MFIGVNDDDEHNDKTNKHKEERKSQMEEDVKGRKKLEAELKKYKKPLRDDK